MERIKENFKKNKITVIIISVAWLILISATLIHFGNTLGKESDGGYNASVVYEIDKDTKLTQTISTKEGIQNISIRYATYIRKNSGNIFVKIVGDTTKKVYVDEKTNISVVQDNSFVTYDLNEFIDETKDKTITITLTSDSEHGRAAGVYCLSEPYFDGGKLKINNEVKEAELNIKYLLNNQKYNTFSTVIIVLSIIFATLFMALLLLWESKYEVIFAGLVASFGLIFLVIMSPGAIPDETLHYEFILQTSNNILGKSDIHQIDKYYLDYNSFGDHTNVSFAYNRLIKDFNKNIKLTGKIEEMNSWVDGSYIGYYMPQTIAITMCRLFKVNMIKTFYAGRLGNLIFYVACVYLAIKNSKSFKVFLGVLACLPIFIQQGASLSYDASVNGLILLSISFLFRWMSSQDKITYKDFAFALVVNCLLAPAKVIYGMFALLYWFVPVDRFENKKQKIWMTIVLCAPSVVLISYNILIRTVDQILGVLRTSYIEGINTLALDNPVSLNNAIVVSDGGLSVPRISGKLYTVSYIVEHPIQTLGLYLRTIRFYLSTWFYHSLGRGLAGGTLILPMTYVRFILVVLFATVLSSDGFTPNWKMRIASIGICIVAAMFILTSMLTGWTDREDAMIQGVQGRYFCPLLPYFFIVFKNNKLKISNKVEKYIVCAITMLLYFVVIYILSYTFVN